MLVTSLTGSKAAIAFADFVKNYEKNITAEDVLDGKVDIEELKNGPASMVTGLIDKLEHHSKDNKWTKKQAKNVAEFAKEMGGELMVQTFTAVQRANNLPNLMKVNDLIGKDVVNVINQARSIK